MSAETYLNVTESHIQIGSENWRTQTNILKTIVLGSVAFRQ